MLFTNSEEVKPLVAPGDAYSKLTMNHLSGPNVVFDTFERGKQAYAIRNYDEALDSFTCAIDTLQRDLSAALIHRATVLEMKKDYKGAKQDISRANPANTLTVPDPYLTMANTLLLQNKLREAFLMLHTSMAVVPADGTHYQNLVDLYQRVAAEMDRRNRWITNLLPYEISNRILSLLSTKDCARLSFTCRYWNNYILREWPGLWSAINPSTFYKFPTIESKVFYQFPGADPSIICDIPPSSHEDYLQEVLESIPADKVRVITSTSTSRYNNNTEVLLKAVKQQCWGNIEHMSIHTPPKDIFCDALQTSRNSIKTLKLWNGDYDTNINKDKSDAHFRRILKKAVKICPNLHTVTVYYDASRGQKLIPQLHPTGLALTRLKNLFKLCDPIVREMVYSSTLQFVNDRCPMLQELILGTVKSNADFTVTYSSTPRKPGLTTLKLTIDGMKNPDEYDKKRIATFNEQLGLLIQKNRTSLRSLTLSFSKSYPIGNCTMLSDFANTGLPALTNLDLSFYNNRSDFGPHDLQKLIAVCPALNQVRIYGGGVWDVSVLEELSKLGSLRRLEIDMDQCTDIDHITTDNGDGLTHLVTNSLTLCSFSFGYRCHDISEEYGDRCKNPEAHSMLLTNVIRSVCRSNIQEFDIMKLAISKEEDLVSHLEHIGNSQIRTLKIRINNIHIQDRVIKAFASLRNLSFLTIYDQRDQDDEGCDIESEHLIQIFNEHKKNECGVFVVQVITDICTQSSFAGRKEYPATSISCLDTDSIEGVNYFIGLYAIKKMQLKNFHPIEARQPAIMKKYDRIYDYHYTRRHEYF